MYDPYSLTLEGGAILEIENGSKISVGTLNLGATAPAEKIYIELSCFTGEIDGYAIFEDIYTLLADLGAGGDLSAYFDIANFEGLIYYDSVLGSIFIDGLIIPEPSTYAAIFGVFALGFAAYRKRGKKA